MGTVQRISCAINDPRSGSATLERVSRGGDDENPHRALSLTLDPTATKWTRARGPGPSSGADDEIRTRDPHLGKVMLYQLSHIRRSPEV